MPLLSPPALHIWIVLAKQKWELGTLQTGAASPITQQGELPRAAQGQGWAGTTCHTNPH